MVQFNAVVLREWPASFKDRKLQDLPHLSHTAESLGKGSGHLLERQDLRQIHAAHIGKEQKHAGAHRAPEEHKPPGWDHQEHTALHQQQESRIGRRGFMGHQIPDPVFLRNGVGKLLKRPAPHVVRLDEPHPGDILDHYRVEAHQGVVGVLQNSLHAAKDHPHHNSRQRQGEQRDQRQWDIHRQQIEEDHHRAGEIGHELRQVMGQKQLQLLNVLVEHGLDRSRAPLVQRAQGHLRQMLRDHAPHPEQGAVGPLVGQHPGGPQQHHPPHGARHHEHGAVRDHRRGAGAGQHRVHQPVQPQVGGDRQQPAPKGAQHRPDQPFLLRPCPPEQQPDRAYLFLFHIALLLYQP